MSDLSEIILEQSVQIEQLCGEVDRSWSIINRQDRIDEESIKEEHDIKKKQVNSKNDGI